MLSTRRALLIALAFLAFFSTTCPADPDEETVVEVPTCAPLEDERIAKKLAILFQSHCTEPAKIWESLKTDLPPSYALETPIVSDGKCSGSWNVRVGCTGEGDAPAKFKSAFYCEKVRSGFNCFPDPTPVVKTFAEEDIPPNYPTLKSCLPKKDAFTDCVTQIVMHAPSETGCEILGQTVRTTHVLMDACYQALAASRLQEVFCDRIHRERTRRECFVKVAWARQNPALCRRIDESDTELSAKCLTLGFDLSVLTKTPPEREAFFAAQPAAETFRYLLSSRADVRQAALPSLKALSDDKKKELVDLVLKATQAEAKDKQLYSTKALAFLSGKQNVTLLEAALKKLAVTDLDVRQAALESVAAYQDLIEPRHFEALLVPLGWGAIGGEKLRPILVSTLKGPKTEKDLWDGLQKRKQAAGARAPAEVLESDIFSLNPYVGNLLLMESSEELTSKAQQGVKNDTELVERLKKAAPLLAFPTAPRVYENATSKAISLGELFKKKFGEELSESLWVGVNIEELTHVEGLPMAKVSFPYADQNCRKSFETAKTEGYVAGVAYVPLYGWDGKINLAVAEEDASCNPPPTPAPAPAAPVKKLKKSAKTALKTPS